MKRNRQIKEKSNETCKIIEITYREMKEIKTIDIKSNKCILVILTVVC